MLQRCRPLSIKVSTMTDDSSAASPELTSRDDRTIRTLAQILGDHERASLAFTHFTAARVLVSASVETLETINGWLAFAVAANMITRFVGRLDLQVIQAGKQAHPGIAKRVESLVADLH